MLPYFDSHATLGFLVALMVAKVASACARRFSAYVNAAVEDPATTSDSASCRLSKKLIIVTQKSPECTCAEPGFSLHHIEFFLETVPRRDNRDKKNDGNSVVCVDEL